MNLEVLWGVVSGLDLVVELAVVSGFSSAVM